MKRIFTILATILYTITMWAQSPEKMSYQAVIRNSSDQLVTNTQIGMQISILQGSANGTAVYVEAQTPTTNTNGLVSIEIGGGAGFSTIDWANGPYFIKTETDPTGGTNYTITGTSQLLSVPYALHAKTAETITGTVTETDPIFVTWDKSAGISITESQISDLGSYIETENQNLSDVLSKSNDGNALQIKNIANPTDDQDAVTKSYIKLRVSATGDTLFLGLEQWVIIPGISEANAEETALIIDGSGNAYTFVTIGEQDWLVENLKTTKYNDGTEIPLVTDLDEWFDLSTPGYCWYDNDQNTYDNAYGALYNWYTVNTGNLCPTGWHVPTNAEWTVLTDYLGGTSVAGGKLKESGTAHWNTPYKDATNETGFTALPGGMRHYSSDFDKIGIKGYWWSATEEQASLAYNREMIYAGDIVYIVSAGKSFGFSVRCVRD